MKGPGALRSNYQNQVFEKIKKQSLEPTALPKFSTYLLLRKVYFQVHGLLENANFNKFKK